MSVWTHWNSGPRKCSTFFSEPVSRLSTQTTRLPRSSRCSHRWDPRKPAPPVTRQVAIGGSVPPRVSVANGEMGLEPGELEQAHHRRARPRQDELEVSLARAVVQPYELLQPRGIHEHHVMKVECDALPRLARLLDGGAEAGDRAHVELAGERDRQGVALGLGFYLQQHPRCPGED